MLLLFNLLMLICCKLARDQINMDLIASIHILIEGHEVRLLYEKLVLKLVSILIVTFQLK